MSIKEKIAYSIERTGNPVAPFIIQEAHSAVERLGRLMANEAEPLIVDSFCDGLMKSYEGDMDKIGGNPNFIMAVSSLLAAAIEFYIKAEGPRQ